jgi:hypothetical protein
MPNSKARDLASLLSGSGTGTIAPALVSDQDNTSTGHFDLPAGTTAQRPSTPNTGYIRFNTSLNLTEYWDGATWKAIDAPPVIASVSPTSISDTASSVEIVISGQGFSTSGATVVAIGQDLSQIPAGTVIVNSTTTITATFDGTAFNDAQEDYSIKVTNQSGLASTLEGVLAINASPAWTTSSGTIANISDLATGNHATVSASDPEGTALTYALASGSLPSGLSLNSSTGIISGDPSNVNSATTNTFSLSASDGTNSVNRTFSIIVNPAADGTSASRVATSASAIKSLTGTTTDGYYWIRTPSDNVARQWWCDMNTDGGGYVLIARAYTQLGQNRGNWFDAANAGGFSPGSSGFYRGGGYFNNNSQDYIMVETNAGGQVRKARFYWAGYNFNTIPSRNFNQFSHNASNAPQFASNFNGYSSSIKGAENFSEQFVVAFSGRGAGGNMDRGEWGAYFMIGAHYNGTHQHHEEAIGNNDNDGTGAHIYGGDIRHDNHSGSGYAVATYGAYTNFWAKT